MEFLNQEEKQSTRRTWVKWILGSAIGVSIFGILRKKEKPKMIKMLTKDGTLVEVPADKLPKNNRKVTKQELQTWVWKHNS